MMLLRPHAGGRTPLHYAASMGHVDCIRALLSHPTPNPGIDLVRYPNTARTRLVDIANDAGYTPLHYAAWAGNASSIRALVSFEANLTPKNVAAVGFVAAKASCKWGRERSPFMAAWSFVAWWTRWWWLADPDHDGA